MYNLSIYIIKSGWLENIQTFVYIPVDTRVRARVCMCARMSEQKLPKLQIYIFTETKFRCMHRSEIK